MPPQGSARKAEGADGGLQGGAGWNSGVQDRNIRATFAWSFCLSGSARPARARAVKQAGGILQSPSRQVHWIFLQAHPGELSPGGGELGHSPFDFPSCRLPAPRGWFLLPRPSEKRLEPWRHTRFPVEGGPRGACQAAGEGRGCGCFAWAGFEAHPSPPPPGLRRRAERLVKNVLEAKQHELMQGRRQMQARQGLEETAFQAAANSATGQVLQGAGALA